MACRNLVVQFVLLLIAMPSVGADLDWVRISDDGKGFTLANSGQPFVPRTTREQAKGIMAAANVGKPKNSENTKAK